MENYFTAPGMNCPSSATLLPGLLPFLPKSWSWSFFHIWKFYDGGYCFCSRCLILIDNVSPPSKFLFITYDHGERNVTPVTERCDLLPGGDAGLWLALTLTPVPRDPGLSGLRPAPCHDVTMTHEAGHWSHSMGPWSGWQISRCPLQRR